ncbi:MAG: DUF1559 domain-containing protein, partial [Thermoguttaceae bacterium]
HDTFNEFPNSSYIRTIESVGARKKATWTDIADWNNPPQELYRWGFATEMLPFIEQQALYSGVAEWMESRTTGLSAAAWSLAGAQANVSINGFLCPSDPSAKVPGSSGRINYHACQGDTQIENSERNQSKIRGIFCYRLAGTTSMASITDGTSNTVLFGECAVMPPGGTSNVIGGLAIMPSANFTPSTCLGRKVGRELTGSAVTNGLAADGWYSATGDSIGMKWFESLPVVTVFNTILPPNSPSCSKGSTNYPSSGGAMVSASSFHSGGANVVLADGSVRFIPETIDCGSSLASQSANATLTSASPYGVWGAAGTKSSGESKALP